MKKTVFAAALAFAAAQAPALGAGLGMSIQSGDPTLYIPFDVGESFRVEPFLRYTYDKIENRDDFGSVNATEVTKVTQYDVGIGLFGLTEVTESVRAYFGGRLAYASAEVEAKLVDINPPVISPTSNRSKGDGFVIAPTIGLQYDFTERFSIAGEVSLVHRNMDGDGVKTESTGTDTNVVVRYRF